jgi:uncharacterized protein (TIRG00374 family)
LKNLRSIIKYTFTLIIAFGLLWYVFRDIDLTLLFKKVKTANFTFVYISIALSLVSHFLRGYRWTLLLKPINYRVNPFRAFIAVMVGYFANLLLPRMGEITRCAILKKTDNVAIPASFGTVISERILDLILLVFLIFSTIIIEFKVLKNFLSDIFSSMADTFNVWNYIILGGVLLVLIIAGIFIYHRNKESIKSSNMYQKIRPFISDLINGLNSIRRVKEKTAFFISTFLIWVLYYLMSYLIVFSFPETSELNFFAGLSILMAGGLGMAAPVQGGIGTYHAFVGGVLMLYGISKEDGLMFATLLHTSQFVSIMVFGGISFIISLFLHKNPNGNEPENIEP